MNRKKHLAILKGFLINICHPEIYECDWRRLIMDFWWVIIEISLRSWSKYWDRYDNWCQQMKFKDQMGTGSSKLCWISKLWLLAAFAKKILKKLQLCPYPKSIQTNLAKTNTKLPFYDSFNTQSWNFSPQNSHWPVRGPPRTHLSLMQISRGLIQCPKRNIRGWKWTENGLTGGDSAGNVSKETQRVIYLAPIWIPIRPFPIHDYAEDIVPQWEFPLQKSPFPALVWHLNGKRRRLIPAPNPKNGPRTGKDSETMGWNCWVAGRILEILA